VRPHLPTIPASLILYSEISPGTLGTDNATASTGHIQTGLSYPGSQLETLVLSMRWTPTTNGAVAQRTACYMQHTRECRFKEGEHRSLTFFHTISQDALSSQVDEPLKTQRPPDTNDARH
jgi:hypothetical protein